MTPCKLRSFTSIQMVHTHTTYSHTTCTHTHNLLTHNLLTHNLHTHTTYSHTTYSHKTCTRTHYSHTTCSHTTCPHKTYSHTTCTHTQLTHTHTQLAHTHTTYSHTTCTHTHNLLTHTTCSHTTCPHTQLVDSFTWQLCVAGVALCDIHIHFVWQVWHFAWQAWHLWHWAGSGGALGFICGAGKPRLLAWQAWLALGDIHLCFTWQACDFHFCVAAVARMAVGVATSIFVSRGRRGARAQLVVTQLTHTQLAHTQLVITPLAHTQLVVTQLTLAWQVWHLWHWAGSGGALGFRCGAGTPRLLAWQAWHLETSISVSRGRCGTW